MSNIWSALGGNFFAVKEEKKICALDVNRNLSAYTCQDLI